MTVLDAKSEAVKAVADSKKTIGDLAKAQGKHPIDVFLDLAVADNLNWSSTSRRSTMSLRALNASSLTRAF